MPHFQIDDQRIAGRDAPLPDRDRRERCGGCAERLARHDGWRKIHRRGRRLRQRHAAALQLIEDCALLLGRQALEDLDLLRRLRMAHGADQGKDRPEQPADGSSQLACALCAGVRMSHMSF